MELRRERAIVLRDIPYEERHRVVTALTENLGKITALARNSVQSRRFGGTLDAFAASEWEIGERPGAELYSLNQTTPIRTFEGLRQDFGKLSLASAWNELMLKIAPERTHCPELFKLHSNALVALEEIPGSIPKASEAPLLNAYLAKLLQWSGHQPQVLECLGCQKPLVNLADEDIVHGLVTEAGWLCSSCRTVDQRSLGTLYPIRARVLGDFLYALTTPIRKTMEVFRGTEEEHRELFAFMEALLVYHVPGLDRTPIKSLRFLGLPSILSPGSSSLR